MFKMSSNFLHYDTGVARLLKADLRISLLSFVQKMSLCLSVK